MVYFKRAEFWHRTASASPGRSCRSSSGFWKSKLGSWAKRCLGAQLAISVHNCPVLADSRFPMSIFKRTQLKYVKKAYRVRNWREYETGVRNFVGALPSGSRAPPASLINLWSRPGRVRRKPGFVSASTRTQRRRRRLNSPPSSSVQHSGICPFNASSMNPVDLSRSPGSDRRRWHPAQSYSRSSAAQLPAVTNANIRLEEHDPNALLSKRTTSKPTAPGMTNGILVMVTMECTYHPPYRIDRARIEPAVRS